LDEATFVVGQFTQDGSDEEFGLDPFEASLGVVSVCRVVGKAGGGEAGGRLPAGGDGGGGLAEGAGEVGGGRFGAELLGEVGPAVPDPERLLLQGSWRADVPGLVSQVAFQYPGDGGHRELRERSLGRIVSLGGFDQAKAGDLAKIVDFDPAAVVWPGEGVGQGEMPFDEPLDLNPPLGRVGWGSALRWVGCGNCRVR